MIRLTDLLNERDGYPKGKYVKVTDKKELEDISSVVYDLIKTAYKDAKGGSLKFNSPKDVVRSNVNFWKVADIDSDPELDVVYFGKDRAGGTKMTGIGHDGDSSNIKKLLKHATKQLSKVGHYAEVSGAPFRSFVVYGGLPTIDDEERVRKILRGKDIEWHGEHPTKNVQGKGWYSRKIGGNKTTKIIVGVPKI